MPFEELFNNVRTEWLALYCGFVEIRDSVLDFISSPNSPLSSVPTTIHSILQNEEFYNFLNKLVNQIENNKRLGDHF